MELAYRRYGSGDPVIVLHGLFGSRDNWHSICSSLANAYEVFALDLRNHGESPHSPGMTYSELASDVGAFIDQNLQCPPHLLGHSMGAKTAMQLATSSPERVRTLTSVDIGPWQYPPRHQQILDALLGLNISSFYSRAEVDAALTLTTPDAATRRFLLKSLVHEPHGGLRWKIGLQQIASGYLDLCAAISGQSPYPGPAFFLRGELSDYLSPDDLPRLQELFPRAQLTSVRRASHWVQADNPAETLQELLHFLGTSN